VSVAVLALFSSVALVGCGGGGGDIEISKDQPTTTVESDGGESDGGESDGSSSGSRDDLVDFLADSEAGVISPDEAECIADSVDGLSEDAYGIAADGGDLDLSVFSDDDADTLVAAFDDCIRYDDLVERFAEQMTSQAGLPLTDDEGACAAATFAEEYGGSGEFIREVSALGDEEAGVKIFEALGPCISDESAVGFLTQILETQGQDETVAACVAEAVVDDVGAEAMLKGFAEAGTSGTSPELEGSMTSALLSCGGDDFGAGDDFGSDDSMTTIPGIGGGISGN